MAEGMNQAGRQAIAAALVIVLSAPMALLAADLPITKNPSIADFQNRTEDVTPYNFDAPPQGMFRTITTAEGFDEQLGFQRTHEIVPVKPTDQFRPDTQSIFIVFLLHQHYQGFKVFGHCYPEAVDGLDPALLIGQDAMHIALEDLELDSLTIVYPGDRHAKLAKKIELIPINRLDQYLTETKLALTKPRHRQQQ